MTKRVRYSLKIDRKGKKVFLSLNDNFIPFSELSEKASSFNENDLFTFQVFFEGTIILSGSFVFQNKTSFINYLHSLSVGKIVT